MGTDTPISALSDKPKLLYTYFKQNFAQVTNPPIDPIREELVMSLVSFIGPRPNILDLEGTSRRKRLEVRQPILTNEDLEKIRCIGHFEDRFDTKTLDITYPAELGAGGARRRARPPLRPGRGGGARRLQHHHPVGPHGRAGPHPDPGAARHRGRAQLPDPQGPAHLGRPRRRDPASRARSIISPASPATAPRRSTPISPSRRCVAMQATTNSPTEVDEDEVVKRYIKSIGKGMLKVMSKMGISTYQSYCGAQIFDAVGLQSDFVDRDFFGTATTIEGVGMAEVAEETVQRHRDAFGDAPIYRTALDVGGEYAYRLRGEEHAWNPDTVATLQHAVRLNAQDRYREFARLRERAGEPPQDHPRPVPHQDAPRRPAARPCRSTRSSRAKDIVKRFATGAMSFGSISREAHETLALAMNSIGGKSNTGEGGEEPERFRAAAGRALQALGHQAGGLRPLRRDDGISRQCRHDADQGRAGRKARRGRPAARPQGRREDRPRAPLDARASA